MEPSQGKKIGFAIAMVGALGAFGGMALLDTNLILGAVVALVGLGILWFGFTIRDISTEVEYERDVLD